MTSMRVESVNGERKLATFQAARLSRLTGLSTRRLLDESLSSLSHSLRSVISPELLDSLTLTGRVLRRDDESGEYVPVRFATVHVEDTDCHLLGYFPAGWPWAWYYPLCCRREEIDKVTTDANGVFSVRLPRFDVDWILRWRHGRLAFADLFHRVERGVASGNGRSSTATSPLLVRAHLEAARRASPENDSKRTDRRTPTGARQATATRRAFTAELPSPLPPEILRLAASGTLGERAVVEAIAERLDVSMKRLEGFDLTRCIGPFERSREVDLPEWTLLTDVPDITFCVTQRVDGADEAIYEDANFDARWNAVSLPDITLVASPHASRRAPLAFAPVTSSRHLVGLHPILHPGGHTPPYIESATGYSIRSSQEPARHHGEGFDMNATDPAADLNKIAKEQSPSTLRALAEATERHTGTLQLYGDVRVPGAKYYRVLRRLDDGATFVPLAGISWPVYRASGKNLQIHWTAADPDGWYQILPANDHWFPNTLLMEWPQAASGTYVVRVECADEAKQVIGERSVRTIEVDGDEPRVIHHQLAWKFASEPEEMFYRSDRNLLVPCPTIRRDSSPEPIQILFRVSAAASHFRYASLGASGCGDADFVLTEDSENHTSHWYTSSRDETKILSGRFQLNAGSSEGAYSFNVYASSRRPAAPGGNEGQLMSSDSERSQVYVSPTIPVAILF